MVRCHQELLEVHTRRHHVKRIVTLILAALSVHLAVVVHVGRRLVVACQRLELLLLHEIERSLHATLSEIAHLIWPIVVHHPRVHVWLIVVVVVLVDCVVEHQVLAAKLILKPMDSRMTA